MRPHIFLVGLFLFLFQFLALVLGHGESKPKIDIPICNNANCFRVPSTSECNSYKTCDAVASFKYVKQRNVVEFQLATKHAYVAFGQNLQNRPAMVKLRGQYCAKLNSFGHYHGNDLKYSTRPTWITDAVPSVKYLGANVSDGILTCKYERVVKPLKSDENYLYDLNQTLYAVMAFGSGFSGCIKKMISSKTCYQSGRPSYHQGGNYLVSSAKVDFLDVSEISGESSISKMYKAHGILMIIAFMLLSTVGIWTSAYLQKVIREKKMCGSAAWFRGHQGLMVSCVLLVIISFIVILVEKKGWDEDAGRHHWTGLFAIIAMLIQPVMALIRPAPDHPRRPIFKLAHGIVGYSGWILGGLAIIFAFEMFRKDVIAPLVFMIVVGAISFIVDILLCFFGGKKETGVASHVQESGAGDTTVITPINNVARYAILISFAVILLFSLILCIYSAYEVGIW